MCNTLKNYTQIDFIYYIIFINKIYFMVCLGVTDSEGALGAGRVKGQDFLKIKIRKTNELVGGNWEWENTQREWRVC